jgi:CPA1 family monovalent cation:H+ antiporter
MELSITSVLSLFCLLALSAVVYYAARRTGLPYTVLLVAVGLALVPFVRLPYLSGLFGFLDDLQLTPELLFYLFLPVLIFESGYSMNIRTMLDSAWTIVLLAVAGLLISAFGIAGLLHLLLNALGFPVPFVVLLLFGAIISATDPVAVLGLFKDFGAPRRLSIIFEGESLFNDGTAVALFLVVLGVTTTGFDGVGTVLSGSLVFLIMVVAGIGLGLVGAGLFGLALRHTRGDDFVSATLLTISAHLVFITGEVVNEQEWSLGVDLRVSSIIATTVSSLFLGNYARHSLTPRTEAYVDKAVSHLAFVANSLVFLLAGLLFASTEVEHSELWLVMVLTVLVVAGMRAVSVFAVTVPVNALHIDAGVPRSWQWLMSWGSLRGALAIIVVLLIPEDLAVPGWTLTSPPRDFLLALTISCILTTLFLKAPLIGPIMHRLRIDSPEPVELARKADLRIYCLLAEQAGFEESETRALVREEHYALVVEDLAGAIRAAVAERQSLVDEHGIDLFERSLLLTAMSIESVALKELYVDDEVGELTYRRLLGKLRLQTERVQNADLARLDPHTSRDRKDIFDALAYTVVRTLFHRRGQRSSLELLESARAQLVMSRRVVTVLSQMQSRFPADREPASASTSVPVTPFLPDAFDRVMAVYRGYDRACGADLDRLAADGSAAAATLGLLAAQSSHASALRAVADLRSHGVATERDEDWLSRR